MRGFSGKIPDGLARACDVGMEIEALPGAPGVTREHPGSTGHVHFRMRTLTRSPDRLAEMLAAKDPELAEAYELQPA